MAFPNRPFSIFLSILLLSGFASFCSANNGGVTVNLIHRDSPLSPSYNPSLSQFDRLRRSFHRSLSRWASVRTTSMSPNLFQASITPTGGEYLMAIGIGTPPVQVLAIADTGSDLTWTQCVPCPNCFKQKDPLFDPTKTSTYGKVTCPSRQCQALGGSGSGCDDKANSCEYKVTYGDSSYTNGVLAVDTFTFITINSSTPDKVEVVFPKVAFGCGHDDGGTFNESASGIIGLGGGALSIVKQLESTIGGRFSYCLTPIDSSVSSKISFGSRAIVSGPNVTSTPLVKGSDDTFYYLTLDAISIGTQRLNYSDSGETSEEEGNMIIDSGTTLTLIPTDLYYRVDSVFEKMIKAKQGEDPEGIFGLCYEVPSGGGGLDVPAITMHFRGADLVLPREKVFIEVAKGLVCLTLVPSGLSIFGNVHQVNYQVGYDLVNRKVSFLPTDCSKLQ